MRLLPRLRRGGWLLRAVVRELSGIRQQLTRQGDLLEALAQHLIPATPSRPQAQDLAETGVSHLDPLEAALVEDYTARTTSETGRVPTDEEILVYLADEKTISLHERLKEREALLHLARRSRLAEQSEGR
jgi:hypothetical protein